LHPLSERSIEEIGRMGELGGRTEELGGKKRFGGGSNVGKAEKTKEEQWANAQQQ
jgi:hypothetical protein